MPFIQKMMGSLALALALVAAVTASPIFEQRQDLSYEYIVIGSGAGGGPLAARLARANHSVLLIESGNDQGKNYNYSVPGLQGAMTQDPKVAWNMYVNHYTDQTRARRDPKYIEGKGILYPRAGTLGGCTSHNAMIWITPHASDWDNIARITGDSSWASSNMQQYLQGVYEWLPTASTDPALLVQDDMLAQHLAGGAAVMELGPDPLSAATGLEKALRVDPNNSPGRDSQEGFYQIPMTQRGGARVSVRDHIVDTVNQGYPLTVRANCFVTKIDFDTSGSVPRATAVEFLDGKHLYKASPLSGGSGTPGSAKATKEIVMSGGSYNTIQAMKLSGIGPAQELQNLGIKVIKDSPGLGTNMQDRYEVPVTSVHPDDFAGLRGCTFDAKPHDECFKTWNSHPGNASARGAYASNGIAATMAINSNSADTSNLDLYIFGGPINFTGYFPHWADAAVATHRAFSWSALKAHTRNHAGTVTLKSTDPLDPPAINFNYFDTGTTADGADTKDVAALVQAIKMSREALARYNDHAAFGGSNFTEQLPGPSVQSDAELEQYVKDVAWGHHACCTAKIGADSDPMAVLDSKFRVRGVEGLRVVDASVFPKIPGVFIQGPIMMIAEKAADAILNG